MGQSIGLVVSGVIFGAVAGVGGTMAVLQNQGSAPQSQAETAASSEASCSIPGAGQEESSFLFQVSGKQYQLADLPTAAQDTYFQIESQTYRNKRDFLEDVALRIALASEKAGENLDVNSLPPLAELMNAGEVSEEEMQDFFEKNKANLPPGATYEQLKPQLQQFLGNRALSAEVSTKVKDMESQGILIFGFSEPTSPLVDLPVDLYPKKGATQPAVTLVEVSDYLCPHCRSVQPQVDRVLEEFPNQVQFVQVDFALRPAGLSGYLVRGAYCARQQSDELYWKYHKAAFEVPLDAARAESEDSAGGFRSVALNVGKDVGAEVTKLEECIESSDAQSFVQTTNNTFSERGVNGTPTFFLNNRKLVLAGKTLSDAVRAALEDPETN